MNGLQDFWAQSDAVGRTVAALLLLMSVSTWVIILWKGWMLRRARRGLGEGSSAFWQAGTLAQGRERLAALDREQLLLALVDSATEPTPAGTLQAAASNDAQLTRRLRDALHAVLVRLQSGQVLLASVGATAPFIGLFGTVWGIYHALLNMADGSALSLDKVAGPVGESLIMTAAGLAVAIPAVLAYNLYAKWLGQCEAELEGFAHDLRDLVLQHQP